MTEIQEIYVPLKTNLLVIGDSIIINRHHASNGSYEDDDPQNQIGGIVPALSLSDWLRHELENVVQQYGDTVYHPGKASANFRKDFLMSARAGVTAPGRILRRSRAFYSTNLSSIQINSLDKR